MALIEMLTDYTHADLTVPKLGRQSQIDSGTLASFDFRDGYTYSAAQPPANVAAGATLANMTDGPAATVGGTALAIGATGLTFAGGNEAVTLPATAKLPAGATMFGFGGWVRHADNSAAIGATCTVAGYNVTNVAGANLQWVLQCARSAAGAATVNYNGVVGGVYTGSIPMAVGELAHMFVVAIIAGGSVTMSAYKNGVLLNTNAPQPLPGGVLPTPAGAAMLGKLPGTAAFVGQIGSFDVEDFTAAGSATVADFLARAYGDNVGRFG